MILATIAAREESTHVATAPSRIRRAASLRCACCAGEGVAGYSTSAFSEDVEESDWSSAPAGDNVVYDVAVNM